MQFLKRVIVFFLLLMVVIYGLLFSIQNTATAPLDLLFIQLSEQKIVLWILAAFALGGLLGMLLSGVAILRLKSSAMLMRRQLNKLNEGRANIQSNGTDLITSGDNSPSNARS